MPVKTLIDNWTLQNAGELIHGQRRGETAHELDVAASTATPQYRGISQDVVAIASLCQLVQHVVLTDGLVADERYSVTWADLPSVSHLQADGLLAPRDFLGFAAHWEPRREALADQLSECTAGIREQHRRNKQEYAQCGRSSDAMLAQVLWGASGMLARAEFSRLPYSPHPLRERLLIHSRFLSGDQNAQRILQSFVDGQQLKLYQQAQLNGVYGTLRLPPVAVQAINDASALSQVIPAAVQLRSKYAELRGWLGELQRALSVEDIEEILNKQTALRKVADNMDRLIGSSLADGITSVQIGVDFQPKLNVDLRLIRNAFRNRFAIQTQISRLVLSPPGRNAFRRLLRLLGEEHTERGMLIEREYAAFTNG
jgi:hypothetical protein